MKNPGREVAVNHAKAFMIKMKFALSRRKAPLDFKARPRKKTYGVVSALLWLIAVHLGQDLLCVMLNRYKPTQL